MELELNTRDRTTVGIDRTPDVIDQGFTVNINQLGAGPAGYIAREILVEQAQAIGTTDFRVPFKRYVIAV